MREIKFRGKRKDNGKWVYGDLTRYSESMAYITVDVVKNEVYEVDAQTVGQYTDLKDRNGKEIYEGDILKVRHESKVLNPEKGKYKIEYSDMIVRVHAQPATFICYHVKDGHDKPDIQDYYTHLFTACQQEVEVIGNIYENKDLLK